MGRLALIRNIGLMKLIYEFTLLYLIRLTDIDSTIHC